MVPRVAKELKHLLGSSFDSAFCTAALEHLQERDHALRKCFRKNGLAVVEGKPSRLSVTSGQLLVCDCCRLNGRTSRRVRITDAVSLAVYGLDRIDRHEQRVWMHFVVAK